MIVSLAAGIAVAVAVNSLNQKVWTYHDLDRALKVPVLVEIPAMDTTSNARRDLQRKLAHAMLFLIIAGVYLGGIYYLYRMQSPVLRVLDPIIERIEERATKQS